MKIRSKNQNKWDKLYDPEKISLFAKLEEKAINLYFANIFTKKIMSICNIKKGKILEPGCGSGSISLQLAKHDNVVTLFDLSPNALGKAMSSFEKNSFEYQFVIGDLFRLPFKDNQYDLVFNQGVMEHFKLAGSNPGTGVQEMYRVLNKGATLIILVPAYFSPLHIVYMILKAFNLVEKLWPYEDQEFLHKHELLEMMKYTGAKNITVKRVWSSLFFSLIGYCKKD